MSTENQSGNPQEDDLYNPYTLTGAYLAADTAERDDLREEVYAAFVGPNADYYLEQWRLDLLGTGSNQGMNWSACLLTGFWLPYRKLYFATAVFWTIIILLSALAPLFFQNVLGKKGVPRWYRKSVGMVAMVIVGSQANRWYLHRAQRVIRQVQAQRLPRHEMLRVLASRGGTSLWAALITVVLVVPSLFLSHVAIQWLLNPK